MCNASEILTVTFSNEVFCEEIPEFLTKGEITPQQLHSFNICGKKLDEIPGINALLDLPDLVQQFNTVYSNDSESEFIRQVRLRIGVLNTNANNTNGVSIKQPVFA